MPTAPMDHAGTVVRSTGGRGAESPRAVRESSPDTAPREAPAIGPLPSLTDAERQILEFMVSHLRSRTYQPSVREIATRFGIKSTKTVSGHLQSLADKGFIDRNPSRSRGIRIRGLDLRDLGTSLPYFEELGDVSAGLRRGTADARLALDRSLAGAGGGFVVRAPGGLPVDAGIGDGDLLVVRAAGPRELAAGDVVVAVVEGKAGLHRVQPTNEQAVGVRRRDGSRSPGLGLEPLGADARALGGDTPLAAGSPTPRPAIVGRVTALLRSLGDEPLTPPITTH